MVTGDNIITAKAIGVLCGILEEEQIDEEDFCVLGPAFNEAMGGIIDLNKTGDEKKKDERVRHIDRFKIAQ